MIAAHCIKPKDQLTSLKASEVVARLGAHTLNATVEPGRNDVVVQRIDVHEDWNSFAEAYDADIAMLTLEKTVLFTRYIKPICLWNSKSEPESKTGTCI